MAYLTAPDPKQTGWPAGVKYIIGNEGCERFSFYGMKAILQVHLTVLFAATGLLEDAAEVHAQEMVHVFIAGAYALPMIGAIISDRLAGKYHTIIWLSLVYCAGHAVLAVGENSIAGMMVGLGLIAIGSGGIKPCVSAHVGDQFGAGNHHLVSKVFQAFYFIINFGSFFATILIPFTRDIFGTSVAFGIPGILMFLATIMFWMGRHVFIHVPPHPGGRLGLYDTCASFLLFMGFIALPLFLSDALPSYAFWGIMLWCAIMGAWVFEERQAIEQDDGFLAVMYHSVGALIGGGNQRARSSHSDAPAGSVKRHWFFASAADRFGEEQAEGPRAVLRIISVFLLVSVFWALFDQHSSSWVRQASRMYLPEITLYDAPKDAATDKGETQAAKPDEDAEDDRVWWQKLIPPKIKVLPSQFASLNPLMVMILIPLVNFVLYPAFDRWGFPLSPLRKMSIGMGVASLAFASVAIIQQQIDVGHQEFLRQVLEHAGEAIPDGKISDKAVSATMIAAAEKAEITEDKIHVMWQAIPYFIMTLAEVMVSITGLEFAYTQAPTRMKSTIMGFWLLTVALGNKLTAVLTVLTDEWELTKFFWLFAGLMAGAGVLFALRAAFYKYRTYTQ